MIKIEPEQAEPDIPTQSNEDSTYVPIFKQKELRTVRGLEANLVYQRGLQFENRVRRDNTATKRAISQMGTKIVAEVQRIEQGTVARVMGEVQQLLDEREERMTRAFQQLAIDVDAPSLLRAQMWQNAKLYAIMEHVGMPLPSGQTDYAGSYMDQDMIEEEERQRMNPMDMNEVENGNNEGAQHVERRQHE